MNIVDFILNLKLSNGKFYNMKKENFKNLFKINWMKIIKRAILQNPRLICAFLSIRTLLNLISKACGDEKFRWMT